MQTKGGQFTKRAGLIEPLAFLYAWLDCDIVPGKTHGTSDPTVENVLAYAASHRQELEALRDFLVAQANA